jgi:hypothetical protein
MPAFKAKVALAAIDRPSRDDAIHQLNLPLSDKAHLIAFLQTLNGAPKPFSVPELPLRRVASRLDICRQRTGHERKSRDHQYSDGRFQRLDLRREAWGEISNNAGSHHAAQSGYPDHRQLPACPIRMVRGVCSDECLPPA